MHLDIVTPERQLMSAEVSMVQIPGMEGDMAVMGNHAPTITTLRPGVLTVTGSDGVEEFVVTGGFAEISAAGTSVLAEQAVPRGEAGTEMLEELLASAKEALASADDASKAAMGQRVNDISDLMGRMG